LLLLVELPGYLTFSHRFPTCTRTHICATVIVL